MRIEGSDRFEKWFAFCSLVLRKKLQFQDYTICVSKEIHLNLRKQTLSFQDNLKAMSEGKDELSLPQITIFTNEML